LPAGRLGKRQPGANAMAALPLHKRNVKTGA
jgi:hypothetical protein